MTCADSSTDAIKSPLLALFGTVGTFWHFWALIGNFFALLFELVAQFGSFSAYFCCILKIHFGIFWHILKLFTLFS